VDTTTFKGKKLPPVPPAPDLNNVKYGEPITLFNGKDLTGWTLTNPEQNQWLESRGWNAGQRSGTDGRCTAYQLW